MSDPRPDRHPEGPDLLEGLRPHRQLDGTRLLPHPGNVQYCFFFLHLQWIPLNGFTFGQTLNDPIKQMITKPN